MIIRWPLAIAVVCIPALALGGWNDREMPKTTPILIHQRLNEACELVQSGRLLQYRDYSAVAVDGVPGELYSLELAPADFLEPANGAGKGIKSASKAGFVIKASDAGSTPSDLPRVVVITTGAECPAVQDAVTLAAKQRDSRRASIQAKLYRPGVDDITRPTPESSPQPKSDTQNAATIPNVMPPTGKPKVTHGTVVLAVAIGPDGVVKDAKVARSLDPWLDAKAMEAVRIWKFRPARKQGLPVAALMTVEVNFNLN